MDKLTIKDPRKIKITKIKNWCIYFEYDKVKYILHESKDGYETDNTLYRKIYDGNRYELEFITGNPYVNIRHLVSIDKGSCLSEPFHHNIQLPRCTYLPSPD